MYQNLQQTKGLVQGVFDKVFDKYDLFIKNVTVFLWLKIHWHYIKKS